MNIHVFSYININNENKQIIIAVDSNHEFWFPMPVVMQIIDSYSLEHINLQSYNIKKYNKFEKTDINLSFEEDDMFLNELGLFDLIYTIFSADIVKFREWLITHLSVLQEYYPEKKYKINYEPLQQFDLYNDKLWTYMDSNHNIWYHGSQLTTILGYIYPTQIIEKHVLHCNKRIWYHIAKDKVTYLNLFPPHTIFINANGIFNLFSQLESYYQIDVIPSGMLTEYTVKTHIIDLQTCLDILLSSVQVWSQKIQKFYNSLGGSIYILTTSSYNDYNLHFIECSTLNTEQFLYIANKNRQHDPVFCQYITHSNDIVADYNKLCKHLLPYKCGNMYKISNYELTSILYNIFI